MSEKPGESRPAPNGVAARHHPFRQRSAAPAGERLVRLGLMGLMCLALATAVMAGPVFADSPPLAPPVTWVVTVDTAALHGQPHENSTVFTHLRPLSPLQVLRYDGDWAYVLNPRSGGTAYVHSDLLGPGDPPSPYLLKLVPPVIQPLAASGILATEAPLAWYPTPSADAVEKTLNTGTWVSVVGLVHGEDGANWYLTDNGDYLPANALFVPTATDQFGGRWLDVDLNTPATVTAYENGEAVRSFLTIKGAEPRPTPTGTFTIVRRVANETMNSASIGIPRFGPGGYYLTNVLFTQYFLPTGESLHYNYWSSRWGYAGSHGCLGLTYDDSAWLWDWGTLGTPISIHY